jgi:hypothetical protein
MDLSSFKTYQMWKMLFKTGGDGETDCIALKDVAVERCSYNTEINLINVLTRIHATKIGGWRYREDS